jgi:TonB-dependent receptor
MALPSRRTAQPAPEAAGARCPGRRARLQTVALATALLSALFLAVSPGHAQETGSIGGYVYQEGTRTPLRGARIAVEGTNRGTLTDQDGYFRLEGLAAGSYRVTASQFGYSDATVSVTVAAGQLTQQDFELASTAFEMEGVTVTGIRRGQVRSVQQKREALSVVDAISADEIGKLPDLNVAESAQRIPGIAIRTDRGEGRFISIRGTAPNRNNVTFNGQVLASAAGTRATALDLVPAEMVSSIEVSKAVLPDQDANSLGGTVNIETLTAFDREQSFFSGFLYGVAHQQTTDWGGEQVPFRSNLTYGTRFGPDQTFGLVVSGSASRRSFNTSIASPAAWVEEDGVVVPEEFEREVEDNDRQRYALNTNLDWRPSESTQAYARINFSRFSDQFTNSELQFTAEEFDPSSSGTTGRFTEVEAALDIPTTDIDEDLAAVTLGLDQELGANATLDLAGTYSRGTRTRRTFQPEFEGVGTEWALSYDLTDSDDGALTFDDLAAASNPANLTYAEMDVEFEDLVENTYQLGGDLRWDFRSGGNTGFLKFGGQFRLRDKEIDRNEDPWAGGPNAPTLDLFPRQPPSPLQGGATVPVTGDVESFLDYWRQNTNNGTRNTDEFGLDPVESAEEEVEVDAFVTEDVYAGYLMGNYRVGRFTATGGVRIEATTTTSERYQFVNDDSFDNAQTELIEAENSYTDVLPSLHLVYRLSDRLQLRGAWSNTIGRPDYDELASFQEIEFEEDELDQWVGFIEEGNPELSPLRSMNVDVSLEFYPGPGSIISIGGFYKRIDDPIYTFVQTERDFRGSQLESLFGVELQRAVRNIPSFGDRNFQEFEFIQLRNADQGTLSGVEISFAQVFDFLPGALAGFGISSNAAFMQSDVTVPGRDDELPLFDQSDVVVNIAPYYQYGPLELRAAYNYQSEFLAEVSDDPIEDEYGDERTTIDLSGRYDLLDGRVQINAYVRNLTNEVEREFQALQRRGIFNAETGRTFELGFTIIP